MAITILNNPTKKKREEASYSSFEELKKTASSTKETKARTQPKAAPRPPQKMAAPKDQKPSTINNGIIKPKYLQDSSVVYKKSGYVKDLLGEGK